MTDAETPKKKKGWLGRLFGGTEDEAAPDTEERESGEQPAEGPAEASFADAPEAPETPVPDEGLAEPAPEPVSEPKPETEPEPEVAPEPDPVDLAAPEPVSSAEPEAAPEKKSWFQRLREGLSRSSSKLSLGITDLFTKRKLDDEALEDLEDLLIQADMGVATAAKLSQALAKTRFGKDVDPDEIRQALAEEAARILNPVARPLEIDRTRKPHVVLVVGVNGAGKTTTIGKMAKQYVDQGLRVTLAAGDTFRAAAVEQLKVWGDRTGAPVVARDTGADAAGLAFDAFQEARARGDDILLVDTAGRLHNKQALMDELSKIRRVLKKIDPDAPHSTLLVLDATVGQNAHQQVKVFGEMVEVTGLAMTKLDGTAKGGVVVALAQDFDLPVHFIGVGETAEDLRPFKAEDFARSLMGL